MGEKFTQCNADLISKSEKCSEEPGQVHLTGTQLSSARVVCPIEGSRTVHYQESISVSVGSSRQEKRKKKKKKRRKEREYLQFML